MVQAYRLLVQKLNEGGIQSLPLHLGVTGSKEKAEDGRINSASGNWDPVLEDGLGGYSRVFFDRRSRNFESAGGKKLLIDRYTHRHSMILFVPISHPNPIHPFSCERRSD